MAEEIKSNTTVKAGWPRGVRLPIVLTFEHQAGEGAPPAAGDRPNYMVAGTMEYGARKGIWNILELLEQYRIKATFFVCGTAAERYPDAVREAERCGHEIAGMSYKFESVRTASTERERSIVRKTTQVLKDITGSTIQGWRCPDYRVSPQTPDILAQEGFAWDSSFLNDDLPYLFDCGGRCLVEIPFTTSTADKTFIGYPHPQRGGPDGLANVWGNEFEFLWGESEKSTRFLILSLQTWATGRPAPLRILRRFLDSVVEREGIRFARCSDICKWWLGEGGNHS